MLADINRRGRVATWARVGVCYAALAAAAAGAAGRAQFVDYYTSASTLIATLNGVAADVEGADFGGAAFSEEAANGLKAQLVKVREGFSEILTYDDHTNELNEGYILYIDKVLLALMLAGEYRERGGDERLVRLEKLLVESGALRARLNEQVRRDKAAFGLE